MSSLNDLTNYDQPLNPNSIDIRTEYLEPISSSTLKYTFRLDQTGYLDTNSMLVFKLKSVGADQNLKCRVNQWNGALGGIKRVIFQIGDNIINDIQDVYKYSTLKNMNMGSNMRNNFLGHYLGNSMWLDGQKSLGDKPEKFGSNNAYTINTYAEEYLTTTGSVVVDHAKSGIDFGKFADGQNAQINSHAIGNDTAVNTQYGIPLGMLIPALKNQKIPLFLFDKQRILLTFEFNTADVYCNNIKASKIDYNTTLTSNAQADRGDVVPAEVRMVIDYIVMPTDVQNELVEQTRKEGGYKLEFYDVVNVEKNIGQGTNNQTQEVEHRIGQNNREVHSIIMWKEMNIISMNDGTNTKGACLMGAQKCQGFSREEYNCNIDGRDEFDHSVFHPVSQYNEVSEVLGKDLQVARAMYCCDENTQASNLSPLSTGLLGTMKPLALSLRNGNSGIVGGGRQVGNYPIVWKWRRDCHDNRINSNPQDDFPVKCNYFVELSRVANVLDTGKGTSVVVSY